jgi:hypothetical protein
LFENHQHGWKDVKNILLRKSQENKMKKLLIISFWIGIIADALATALLFFPAIANIVLQPQPFEMSAIYLYVTRVAGALMFGWTVLLFWAVQKPIERSDILLITLVPVVTLLAVAAVLFAESNQIPTSNLFPMFILYFVLFCTYIPAYIWAKKQKVR